MSARTFDQVIKGQMGDMAFAIAQMTAANEALRAENEDLKAKLHQAQLEVRRLEPEPPALRAMAAMSTTQRPS